VELVRRWSRAPESWPDGAARPPSPAEPEEALIVAADLPGRPEIERLAEQVAGVAGYLKLNSGFLAHGPELVAAIRALGLEVFLDLKFHDIPNTAANYAREAVRMGVAMFTLHASGGPGMMNGCVEAAREEAARLGAEPPKVLAVTALTSMSDGDLAATGVSGGRDEQVARLARLAKDSGADGVVCSVGEAAAVRSACGEGLLVVTPGVRPAGSGADDHARSATPAEAVRAGADHVVVGRPIYGSDDPAAAARAIAAELSAALGGTG
jgi:orotidine-5'-phosphate decarboxylase